MKDGFNYSTWDCDSRKLTWDNGFQIMFPWPVHWYMHHAYAMHAYLCMQHVTLIMFTHSHLYMWYIGQNRACMSVEHANMSGNSALAIITQQWITAWPAGWISRHFMSGLSLMQHSTSLQPLIETLTMFSDSQLKHGNQRHGITISSHFSLTTQVIP